MLFSVAVLAGEPAIYRAGIVELLPTLDFEMGSDSNLLNTNENSKNLDPNFDQVSTGYWKTDAAIQAWIQDRRNSYSLAYRLMDGRYFDSDQDNYTDHKLNLDVHLEANSKNAFDIYGEYYATHEARGTGFSQGIQAFVQDKPFLYADGLFGGQYTLGNRKSKGRMELAATLFNRQWDSEELPVGAGDANIDVTSGRDYDMTTLRGEFFWNIAAKTDLLFELKHNTINYDFVPEGAISLDSTEVFGLVGVEWELTQKTTGLAKVGYSNKDFKDDRRGSFSEPAWDVGVAWSPRSYSTFDLLLRRYPAETYNVGSYIDTQEYKIGWEHDWARKFGTKVELIYQYLVFEEFIDQREDDIVYFVIAADYDFFRWLSLGAGYRYQELQSTQPTLDFDRNQLFISVSLSL